MIEISVEVKSDKGRYHPGTAIVRINGEIVARLRGDERFEITVREPSFSTRSILPHD